MGHHDWVEDKMVAEKIKEAREEIKEALKPGRHPGGSKEDNIGESIFTSPTFLRTYILNF